MTELTIEDLESITYHCVDCRDDGLNEDEPRDWWSRAVAKLVRKYCAQAWDNGVDTAGQYATQPWVVDDECKPLNPYRGKP